MQTAPAAVARRAGLVGRRPGVVAAGVAALVCLAAVIGFTAASGEDRVEPTRAAPAPVIDARPLVDPATRFHHRLDVERGASVQIDGRRAAERFHHRLQAAQGD